MKVIFEKVLPHGSFRTYSEKPNINNIVELEQSHSSIVSTFKSNQDKFKADGIQFNLVDIKDYNFAIKTADCIPILFIGEKQAAFIHAGWRGIENRISFNPKVQSIKAHTIFLGPSIQKQAFQVTSDFREYFPSSNFFLDVENKLFFDLQAEITSQLKVEYPSAKIYDSAECTYQEKKYNSYRRNKTNKRNWNIFSI